MSVMLGTTVNAFQVPAPCASMDFSTGISLCCITAGLPPSKLMIKTCLGFGAATPLDKDKICRADPRRTPNATRRVTGIITFLCCKNDIGGWEAGVMRGAYQR